MGQFCTCRGPRSVVEESWRVMQRNCNHSAFNGYAYTPSDWSAIRCQACGNGWRTKAAYVYRIPDDGADTVDNRVKKIPLKRK